MHYMFFLAQVVLSLDHNKIEISKCSLPLFPQLSLPLEDEISDFNLDTGVGYLSATLCSFVASPLIQIIDS